MPIDVTLKVLDALIIIRSVQRESELSISRKLSYKVKVQLEGGAFRSLSNLRKESLYGFDNR